MNTDYYKTHYLATVRLTRNNKFIIEGGKAERMALLDAKKHVRFCYVRDIETQSEVKLQLIRGSWVIAAQTTPSHQAPSSLVLPKQLKEEVSKLAEQSGTSVNQFIVTAVAEKISAQQHR